MTTKTHKKTVITAAECLGVLVDALHPGHAKTYQNGLGFSGMYRYRPGWREALTSKFGGASLVELTDIGAALYVAQTPYVFSLAATIRLSGIWVYNTHTDEAATDSAATAIVGALVAFSRWTCGGSR